MANTDKNIKITPNTGQTSNPKIEFTDVSANTVTLTVLNENNGTLRFSGSSGHLFSISNSTTNSLFTVNDMSGMPVLEVFDVGGAVLSDSMTVRGNLTVNGQLNTSFNGQSWTGNVIGTAYGGTGQTTLDAAIKAMLPTYVNGNVLTNNGSSLSWTSMSGLPAYTNNASKYLQVNSTADGTQWVNLTIPPTLTQGTGVTISNNTINIGQPVGTSNSVTFASINVGSATGAGTGEIRASGNITAYFSDARLKNFVGNISDALDKVLQLNGYYFFENDVAKSLGYNNDKRQVGVSAQEVEAVLPEIVVGAPINDKYPDAGYKTVYYDKLVPLLIEAVKTMHLKVQILEERAAIVQKQEEQIALLQKQVAQLIQVNMFRG